MDEKRNGDSYQRIGSVQEDDVNDALHVCQRHLK